MENSENRMCLTVDEVAKLLGLSRPTAYDLVHKDGFPRITLGRRILVPRAGLEEWLASNTGKTL